MEYFTFDDVLIEPLFSEVSSRRLVDVSTTLGDRIKLEIPIVSANMATVTESNMAQFIGAMGGLAIIHRFCSITDNADMFRESIYGNDDLVNHVAVSLGISVDERDRAIHLANEGAYIFCIDVAHGAQQGTVDQCIWLRKQFPDSFIIVGNFGTSKSIQEFERRCGSYTPDVYKIGIGPGAACLTRVKTGVGVPQLSAVLDCARQFPVIADGGCKKPADVCKSLAAGAQAVMLGSMLAATDESPGEVKCDLSHNWADPCGEECLYKEYAGSAAGGYAEGWKTSEGAKMSLPYKGPARQIVKDIEGGLRSSMTYCNSTNLQEYFDNTEFRRVTSRTVLENGAHGKIGVRTGRG